MEQIITVDSVDDIINIFGKFDENVNRLQKQYDVSVLSRGSDIRISGEEAQVHKCVMAVKAMIERSYTETLTAQSLESL